MVQQTHGNHNYLQFLFQVINTWYTHTYLQANTHKPKLQINNILNKRLQKKKKAGHMAQACNHRIPGSSPANQSTPSAKLQANKRPCLKEGGCFFCGQPKAVLWPPHT